MGFREQKGLGKAVGPSFTPVQVAAKEQAERSITRLKKELRFLWDFVRLPTR